MKIFGIEIGNTAPKNVEEEILKLMALLNNTLSGFLHYEISKKLQALCLKHPKEVASLAFNISINERDRAKLLFIYSRDHYGSCHPKDNKKWTKMMNELVIPRKDELPTSCQEWLRGYPFK